MNGWQQLQDRRSAPVRTLTAMLVVSSLCSLVGAVAPMTPEAPVGLNATSAVTAAVLAALVTAWPLRVWLHVGPLALLGGVCAVIASAATGAGAAGTAMSLLWVAVYAAFFFRRSTARAYAALTVAGLAGALLANPFTGAAHVWFLCSLTAVVAGEAIGAVVAAMDRQAVTDPLTGALNRAGLHREAARVLRGGVSAVAVDLDGFKQVNDAHGHAAGDRLLVELVAAWRPELAEGDVLARPGGDEFVLLLPTLDRAQVDGLLSRLTAASPAAWSRGVAQSTPGESLEDLLRRADEQLYLAKRGTRGHLAA